MTYEEAIEYIDSTLKFGIKPGLERIVKLLDSMGKPQDNLKYIHIAGTNGKGSISTMTANVLSESGYKTGLFVSPYIEDFCERISMNGENISQDELSYEVEKIKTHIDNMVSEGFEHPTEFEVITAIAFSYFNKKGCDYVVLEVGLGGKLDSTNVIKSPLVSVITSISFDHMDVLGSTIEEIAYEKCGIIKRDSSVVLYPIQQEEVYRIVAKIADKYDCQSFLPYVSEIEIISSTIEKTQFYYNGLELSLFLGGAHQIYNCITAVETINVLIEKGVKVTQQNIKDGIAKTKIAGRLEIINKNPLVIIDGAHNLSGINSLCNTLDTQLSNKRIIAVMGMMKDKQYEECIDEISKRVAVFIGVTVNNSRTLCAIEASKIAQKNTEAMSFDDINLALEKALSLCGEDGVLLVCGSLYLISDVKQFFRQKY